MLSIEQLAHARSLSVKISYLLGEIAALPAQASSSGRQMLNRRLEQLNNELAEALPSHAADDRELMNIILHPPKGRIASKSEARSFFTEEVEGMEARQDSPTGCYHVTNQQINRSEILLSQISQWVAVMNNPIKPQDQTIAELKLLFFFGSEEALNVFLALHSQYLIQQETVSQLLT